MGITVTQMYVKFGSYFHFTIKVAFFIFSRVLLTVSVSHNLFTYLKEE